MSLFARVIGGLMLGPIALGALGILYHDPSLWWQIPLAIVGLLLVGFIIILGIAAINDQARWRERQAREADDVDRRARDAFRPRQ